MIFFHTNSLTTYITCLIPIYVKVIFEAVQGLPVTKGVPYLVGRMLPEMPTWMLEFAAGKEFIAKPIEKGVGQIIEKEIVSRTAGVLSQAVAMGLVNVLPGVAEKATTLHSGHRTNVSGESIVMPAKFNTVSLSI